MTKPARESLADLCREQGVRLTGPRKVIMQVLSEATDHPDVEELHRRVSAIDPGIAIATVFRTMNLLEQNGLVEKHTFADGRARYEAIGRGHHDHFINIETGEVVEFRSDEIERIQTEIARRYGFAIVDHRLEIYVRPLPKRPA